MRSARPQAPAASDGAIWSLSGIALLAALTVTWGFYWPMMKLAVQEVPPWTFRTLCVMVGGGALLSTAEGYDPKLMLSWSVDGGNTFKGNRELSLGKRGHYQTQVRTRRLGRFGDKGIMFRLRVSDPVIRGIVAITPSIRPLTLQR